MMSPSEEFVKFFAKRVTNTPFFPSVREKFTPITKNALNQFINDRINDRLKSAMTEGPLELGGKGPQPPSSGGNTDLPGPDVPPKISDEIVTTGEELEGYYIIKAILRENLDLKRIVIRDKKSYCGVLLDDTNRKPICRMYFNTKQKYLGLFTDIKNEEKIPIQDLNEIYNYAERLKSTISNYENSKENQD